MYTSMMENTGDMAESKFWFTSDLHFGHDRDFLYGPRSFESIEEHDKAIIKNWNSVVGVNDVVFVLGDLMLNDDEHGINCLSQLNGHLFIIYGNHDSETRINLYDQYSWLNLLGYAAKLKIKKNIFYLSHYPTITSNYDDGKPWAQHVINLHGHTHSKNKFYNNNPYMYNVALDAHNNYPVSLEKIIEDIKAKKEELDNEN